MALVSFDTAKAHLRITDVAHDAEITIKLNHASAIILDYLKGTRDPEWDELTAPLPVQAATLQMLGLLYEHRGDDLATSPSGGGAGPFDQGTWEAIERLLMRFRDPALA